MVYYPLSDMWKGEQAIMAGYAEDVCENGVIVELGTFKGGTAQLLNDVTSDKNVTIYSVDIAPQLEAIQNLKSLDRVRLVTQTSAEAASSWQSEVGKKIDMIFIDASHRFEHVFEDYNSWIKHLKPGGRVVFHDCDPDYRGGIVHLAVKVCVDTIKRKNIFRDTTHKFKLFQGLVDDPQNAQISVVDCQKCFSQMGSKIASLCQVDFADYQVVCDDIYFLTLKGCVQLPEGVEPVLPIDAQVSPGKKFLVLAHPQSFPVHILQQKGVNPDDMVVLDSTVCAYLLDHGLKKNYEYFYKLSKDKPEFRRLGESLSIMEYSFGESKFPGDCENWKDYTQDVIGFSKIVEAEQLRLNLLSRILSTLVDWNP